ncbi:hypothetical protein ACQ27_gp592 [Klebsiella phage K64-1]|nr:hypothetical protein ACQ27_gp592 [Klebsiella phage K64-1]
MCLCKILLHIVLYHKEKCLFNIDFKSFQHKTN